MSRKNAPPRPPAPAITTTEFRRRIKEGYPHVKIKVRAVSFEDLARASARCLSVTGAQTWQELAAINALARQAGITPDGSLRPFPEATP